MTQPSIVDRPKPGLTDLFSLYVIFTLKSFSSNRNGSKPKLGGADLDTKESGSSGEHKGGWPGCGQFLPPSHQPHSHPCVKDCRLTQLPNGVQDFSVKN